MSVERVKALALRPEAVMLVAAHNGDLRAARAEGLGTAFVARPTEYGSGLSEDCAAEEDWDVVADSLTAVADRLGRYLIKWNRRAIHLAGWYARNSNV